MKVIMQSSVSSLLNYGYNSSQNIVRLNHHRDDINDILKDVLTRCMTDTDDPDIRGKSPDKYISNLQSNKLGDFSKAEIYVYEYNSSIRGIIIALPNVRQGQEYHIYTLGVEPISRQKGIGKSLLAHLCQHLSKIGISKVVLDVHLDNYKAISLYESLGFSVREK